MKMNWCGKVSGAGLRTACTCLDVKKPVKIQVGGVRQAYEDGKTHATYSMRADGSHVINVLPTLTDEEANACIWHELAHAAQVEYYGPKVGGKLYDMLETMIGYADNPLEAEARRWACGMARSVRIVANMN